MVNKPIRTGATSLAALALALCLAGCGSDEPELETTPEPTTQEPTAEPTTPAPAEESPEAEVPDQEANPDQEAALDEYVALEQAQIDAAGEDLAAVYSEVTVSAEYPDTVVYAYTYAEPVDPNATATELDNMVSTMEELTESAVFPAMEATGVTPTQRATFSYYNADGTEIWTRTFES